MPRRPAKPAEPPICPYCQQPSVLMPDSEVRRTRLGSGMVWACLPCGAWVGTHKNSRRHMPLGRLANASLRQAKTRAHALLDPLWQRAGRMPGRTLSEARRAAYAWLQQSMGLTAEECHIGLMDEARVQRVIDLCEGVHRGAAARKERTPQSGYERGRADWAAGVAWENCPYPQPVELRDAWRAGWESEEYEFQQQHGAGAG